MALSFRKFIKGLRIVPESASSSSETGDLEVIIGSGKLQYYNALQTGIENSAIVTESHQATLTNKNLQDSSIAIVDATDSSKKIQFDASGTTSTSTTITAAQTANRVITLPNATDTLVGLATSDVLTNKTLTSPVLNTPTADTITGIAGGALQLSSASGQVVRVEDVSFDSNTVTGGASAFTIQSTSNQNLSLQAQGTGVVQVESLSIDTNTVTGGAATLTIQSASNQNLSLQAQGTGVVQVESLSIDANTVTGGAAALTIQSASNQNTTLQSQGSGNVTVQSTGTGNVSIQSSGSTGVTIEDVVIKNNDVFSVAGQNLNLSCTSGSNYVNFQSEVVVFTPFSFSSSTPANVAGALALPSAVFAMVSANINTIAAGRDAQVIIIKNGSASSITVANSSTPNIGIKTGTGNNIVLAPDASLFLIYDDGAKFWYVIGGAGSSTKTIKTISSLTGTIAATDQFVFADATSNNVAITLPTPSAGKEYTIKRKDNTTNIVSLVGPSGQKIDGQNTYYLEYQYDSITLISDGTDYFIE